MGKSGRSHFALTFLPPAPPFQAVRTLEAVQFNYLRLSPGTCCQAKKSKNNPSLYRVSGRPRPFGASSSHASPQTPPPPAQDNFSFLGPGACKHTAHHPLTTTSTSKVGTPSCHL